MFPKAKIKRFNEEVGCAPPPTKYNPKIDKSAGAAVTLTRSERWKDSKDVTPGPGAYCSQGNSPSQKRSTSSSRLNSSTCSSSSSVSGGGVFLSPPKHTRLSRSASAKSVHGRLVDKDPRGDELQDQIRELMQERDRMKTLISQLEEQLMTLNNKITASEINETEHEKLKKEKGDLELKISKLRESEEEVLQLKQQNEELKVLLESGNGDKGEEVMKLNDQIQVIRKELTESQHMISRLTDERSGLQLQLRQLEESAEQKSLSEEEVQNLKEQIDHLTLLRDNLEASVMVKDDLIAELQLQLDEVVVEGQSFHDQMELYRAKAEQLEEEVQNSFVERDDAENRVRDIVAKYEALIKDQVEEREMNKEILAKKDIEIELLNGSLANLNVKVTEYEKTISSLQEEVSERKSKISCLETTVSDLSMMTKEKEFMESMLEEELNQRAQEVNKLEQSIREVETKLDEVNKEKESVVATLEAERKRTAELNERIKHLEVQIKEKEVVQQFLEKEIASREAEVSESSTKIKTLEEDLETARQVALDLQQDAEVQLNQVLTLKATISAKDYDIEAKEELITTLKNEVSQKLNETSILQGQVEQQSNETTKIEEQLKAKETQIQKLDEELTSVKAALQSREESLANLESKATQLEDNNHQLEEKVVELMAEISDREAEHIARVNRIQNDLDDLGIKYSESLLEHEATRRALTQTSEELERENLLRMASERDIQTLKEELGHYKEEHKTMELNLKDLVQKYTNLEDALACEEAENRDLEDRLEREVKNAQEAAATAEKEISSLQTSNEGFCTQITQLKIDMRKKSQAVVEMQQCIEALREEKQHLTTLRDNLETTVETKEDSIAQLHLQMSTLEREMEEERVTLRSRIADLENHLKETEDHLNNYKTKVTDLEDQVSYLEDEKLKLTKSYEKQLEEKSSSATQAATELVELKKTYEGYEDQLKNLQTSLVEKTNEVDELKEKYFATSRTLDSHQEEMKALETSLGRSKQEVEGMNKTLSSKDSMLDDLNTTLGSKREEIQSLYKSLEEKQSALVKCETRIQQLEENEEKLAQDKEEAALTISTLKESLDNTKKRLSRLEIVHKEEKEAEVSRVTSTLEVDIKELRDTNAELLEELNSWKNKFQHLEKMIEPFREQLDAYEVEKASLLSRSSAAKQKRAFLLSQLIQRLQRQKEPREGQLFGFRTDDGRLLAIALCTDYGNLKHDKSLLLPAPLTPIGKFEVTKGDHSKPELEENEIAVIWDQEDLHVYVSEDQQISTTCFTTLSEEDLSELFVVARVNFSLDLTSRDTVVSISNTIQTLVEQLESPSTCFRLQDSTLILQNKDGGVLSLENQGGKGNVDIGSVIKGAKKKKASLHTVNFQMLQNRSTVTCRNAPVVRIDNRKSGILSTHFKGEAIVYLQKSCKVSKVAALLVQGVIQQLHLAECWLERQLNDKKLCGNLTSYNSLHFLSGHVVNVIYPENSDDKNLEPYRKDVHEALMFPMNQPMVRKGNRLPIIEAKSNVLKNTHIGLKPSSVYGEISVVKGIYGYHHYMQDNFNDNKWGCAYRSLQTLVSWFRFQGYTEKPIPTHSEIQKCLVDIGDKPSSFLDSRQWIGSTEVGFVLDNMYNITSKFIFVSSGADLAEKGRELAFHFQTQGTPIMIGGGVLAHTIIGVDYNTESGDISFLILDPHYTGSEDLSTIQNKGWCGWKGPEFWDPKAYYNLCLPQRPLCI